MTHTLPEIPDDMRAIYVEFKDGHIAFYFKPMDDPEQFNKVALHMIAQKMIRDEAAL